MGKKKLARQAKADAKLLADALTSSTATSESYDHLAPMWQGVLPPVPTMHCYCCRCSGQQVTLQSYTLQSYTINGTISG